MCLIIVPGWGDLAAAALAISSSLDIVSVNAVFFLITIQDSESIMSSLRMDFENEWISIRIYSDLKVLNIEIMQFTGLGTSILSALKRLGLVVGVPEIIVSAFCPSL